MTQKRLRRSNDRVIGGVIGGVANYFNISPNLLRLVICCAHRIHCI